MGIAKPLLLSVSKTRHIEKYEQESVILCTRVLKIKLPHNIGKKCPDAEMRQGKLFRRDELELEDILTAVLVVANQLFALTCTGDGEGVLVLVGDAAFALFAVHGDVAPHTSVGTVAGDVEHLILWGFFFDCLTVYGRHGNRLLGDDFGFGFGLGEWLGFYGYGIQNGFVVVLGLMATDENKWRNSQQNEE